MLTEIACGILCPKLLAHGLSFEASGYDLRARGSA